MLRWLIYANRPFTLHELAEAVAISVDNIPVFDPENRLRHPVDLYDLCPSLVNLHGNADDDPVDCVVRLAHYSVQEYLLSNSVVIDSRISISFEQSIVQTYIGKACLTYLLYLDKTLAGRQIFSREAVQEEYALYKYSAKYWDDHATMTDAITGTLVQEMFCSGTAFIIWNYGHSKASLFSMAGTDIEEDTDDDKEDNDNIEVVDNDMDIEYLHQLYYGRKTSSSHYCEAVYVASYLGLTGLVEKLVGQVEDINMVLGQHGTALGAAAFQGHTGVLQILLERGAQPDIVFDKYWCSVAETSLHAATLRCHVECTRLLIAAGSCVNQRWVAATNYPFPLFETPLSVAAGFGHTDVLQVLIEKGADVNGNHEGTFTKAPLLEAAHGGHAEIVQTLLQNGAHINDIGFAGVSRKRSTPLLTAVKKGNFQMAKLLIDDGADVNVMVTTDFQDITMRDTPLVTAARYGSKDITRLLLENGADVNGQVQALGSSPNVTVSVTPLLEAVFGGFEDIVRLLLTHDPDVKVKGRYGDARETALLRGFDDIAALLPSTN